MPQKPNFGINRLERDRGDQKLFRYFNLLPPIPLDLPTVQNREATGRLVMDSWAAVRQSHGNVEGEVHEDDIPARGRIPWLDGACRAGVRARRECAEVPALRLRRGGWIQYPELYQYARGPDGRRQPLWRHDRRQHHLRQTR